MRILNQGIAAFLQQGIKPRVFVRVFDKDGNDLLLQGTKETGEYEDRITTFGSINQSIRPEGGMAEVSGAEVNRLVLDERLTLCTEASLWPQMQNGIRGAGRILSTSLVYASARNAVSGSLNSPAIVVGRNYVAGSGIYTTARGYLQVMVPAALTTCEDAYIKLTGMGDYSTNDFTIYGLAGTWSDLAAGGTIFNDFTGWAASGNYTVSANWIESWTTAEYGTTVYLRLNQAGRDAIKAAAGSIFRIMLISNRDADIVGYPTGPTGAEYVQFEAESARLELRYNSQTLDNQPIEILYGLETLPSTISGDTLDRVWTGVVDSWKLNDREVTLTAKQNDHKKNLLIPSKFITISDFPDCPEENIGKGYPVIYGKAYSGATSEHKDGIGFDSDFMDKEVEYSGLRDYFPSPVVRPYKSISEWGQILHSGHLMADVPDAEHAGVPAAWNSSQKKFGRLWGIFYPPSGSEAQIGVFKTRTRLTAEPGGTGGAFLGNAFSSIPTGVISFLSATNPTYAYIGDGSNEALIVAANGYIDFGFAQNAMFTGSEKVECLFDLTDGSTGTLSVLIYDVKASAEISGSGTAKYHFPGGSLTDNTVDFIALGVLTGDICVLSGGYSGVYNITDVTTHIIDLSGSLSDERACGYHIYKTGAALEKHEGINTSGQKLHKLTTITGTLDKYILRILYSSSGTGIFGISNLQIRTFSGDSEVIRQTFHAKIGYAFGSWITGRGFTSGDVIENPAGIIEGFARNEMSLLTAEIDTTAFDTAATDVTGKKLAFQLSDRKNARELLDDIAAQSRLLLWWDEQDRLTCKLVDSTDGFPNSLTNVPGDLDIFTTTGDPVSGSFTHHQIISGPEIRPTDKIYNDFVVKYKKNYATNDYGAVLTCNKDTETLDETILATLGTTGAELVTLCDNCYDRIGSVKTLEIEAWAIRDEATATAFIQHLVQWFTKVRTIIEFTAGISAILFEPGDFINVRDDRIEDLFGTAVMNVKKWMITSLNAQLNNSTYHIEAIEV